MPLTYTSVEELETLLTVQEQAALTDDTTETGEPVVDTDMIERYLAYSESTVNTKLQTRYDMPLKTVPLAVVYATLVIARYRLMLRRGYMTEELETEYKEQMRWLQMVQDEDADIYEDEVDEEIAFGTSTNEFFDGEFFL
jgi:phage gp36-like protein